MTTPNDGIDFYEMLVKSACYVQCAKAHALMAAPWIKPLEMLSSFWHVSEYRHYYRHYMHARELYKQDRLSDELMYELLQQAKVGYYAYIIRRYGEAPHTRENRKADFCDAASVVFLHPSGGWGRMTPKKFSALQPDILQESQQFAQEYVKSNPHDIHVTERIATVYLWAKVFSIPTDPLENDWLAVHHRTDFMNYMALDFEDDHVTRTIVRHLHRA